MKIKPTTEPFAPNEPFSINKLYASYALMPRGHILSHVRKYAKNTRVRGHHIPSPFEPLPNDTKAAAF